MKSDRVRIETGASELDLSGRTVVRAIDRGELTKYRQQGRVYIDRAELRAWAAARALVTTTRSTPKLRKGQR